MSRQIGFVLGLGVLCCCLAGCGQPTERLNAPPQGVTDNRNDTQPFFSYMVDNAGASDMSIADIHFVPHTSELNSTGTYRLTRLAKHIEVYGGTVRYATSVQDDALINKRIEHVREFLAEAGADMSRTDVVVAMAGSNYTPANEAMEAKHKGWASSFEETEEQQ